jgi:hypothetical protein
MTGQGISQYHYSHQQADFIAVFQIASVLMIPITEIHLRKLFDQNGHRK